MGKTPGIVAAGHEQTAAAAAAMLREGGNAFDAAVAGMFAASVAEPMLTSLGGGGFLLARPADAPPRLYDFFVQTPRQRRPEADLEFYEVDVDFGTARQAFHIGRGSIGVPGVVRGLFRVSEDLGRMPMREIVAPAVRDAKDGVVLSPLHAYILGVVGPIYRSTAEARAIFCKPDRPDCLREEGERILQPDLADAIDALAHEGADLFYRGEIARRIDEDLRPSGHLALADLERYAVELREPLAVDFAGARLLTNPPPSSGGTLIAFALTLLEGHGFGRADFGSVAHLARLGRVFELTAEARVEAQAAARAAGDASRRGTSRAMLDPDLLARYRDELAGTPPVRRRRGTTHLSAIDGAGNVASVSVTNGEGAGYVVPGTGIMLNNILGEEDLNPEGFHRWPLDTRMMSMMAPTIAIGADGRVVSTGSGGSKRIRTALVQLLSNLLELGMDVEEAVAAPRIHLEDGLLSVEGGFDRARIAPLLAAFPEHQVWDERNLFFGGAHTVVSDRRGMRGAGDPRRDGVCVGV